MECAICGTRARPGAGYCAGCGQSLGGEAAPRSVGSGRYEIQGLLGEGAKKVVHLATDTRLGRDVAVSIVKSTVGETDLIRLRREASAMARLSGHPNIVAVYDTGEEEGHIYIVSEHMAGGDLAGLLKRSGGGRLPAAKAAGIAADVCSALGAAHADGIIHRDVKPANIWLEEHGTAKLGDFGHALIQDQLRLTRAGMMIGTATYISPECASGGPQAADARSDLYSLGVVLFEMVAGRPPFTGNMVHVIDQHRTALPPRPSEFAPEVPGALEGFILRLLEKSPELRPASAEDALAELRAAVPEA